jgi:hypothetical protein
VPGEISLDILNADIHEGTVPFGEEFAWRESSPWDALLPRNWALGQVVWGGQDSSKQGVGLPLAGTLPLWGWL